MMKRRFKILMTFVFLISTPSSASETTDSLYFQEKEYSVEGLYQHFSTICAEKKIDDSLLSSWIEDLENPINQNSAPMIMAIMYDNLCKACAKGRISEEFLQDFLMAVLNGDDFPDCFFSKHSRKYLDTSAQDLFKQPINDENLKALADAYKLHYSTIDLLLQNGSWKQFYISN